MHWRNVKARRMGLGEASWRGKNGLRAYVLRRDAFRCRLRLRGCSGKATTVHISPILGGDHRRATAAHCVSACASCHGKVDGPRAHSKVASRTVRPVADENRFLTAVGRR